MKSFAVLALLLMSPALAGATDRSITSYDVTLAIAADGTAQAKAVVTIEGAAPGTVAVPLGFPGITTVGVTEGPVGVAVSAHQVNGQSELSLTLPEGVPASFRIAVAFRVGQAFQKTEPAQGERRTLPEGVRVFRHSLVNTQPATIARYRFSASFPETLRAHAIREALPKLRKSEAGPRARLADVGGRRGAWIEISRMSQGDATSLQIELVPEGRSLAWLVAGVILSVLYLVYFRDLVKPRAR